MHQLHSFLYLILLTVLLGGCRSKNTDSPEIERSTLAAGTTIESITHRGAQWHVITMDPKRTKPSIRLSDGLEKPLRDFSAFNAAAKEANETTVWMMNAGMYHAGGSPVGLCICNGQEVSPVNRDEGKGNFFLKPNGIFYLTHQGAEIIDTPKWPPAATSTVLCATQSGPLLVHQGKLHPAIRPNSPNELVRNGVGLRADGHLCFIISTGPVSFYEMAIFFRDYLHCPNALYLDGVVSAIYAPNVGLNKLAERLGPVFGLWE
ncbi:MAG: hypothetical protein ACJAQT_002102 [Akkermansiaceae bacterium]|jgi:uncharacterized protein YigE (DUF2233 family)